MNIAINVNTLVEIHEIADSKSAITSQLLFSEYCKILEEENYFYKIENLRDHHIGWVDMNAMTLLTDANINIIQEMPNIVVCVPLADVFCLSDKTIYRLPMGSFIPNFEPDTNKFMIADKVFQIHPSFISYLPDSNREGILVTALSLINTPHLSGGKTLLGSDCSGFVQTVFSANGYQLPRLSAQQNLEGTSIENIHKAEPGDLIFFKKEDVPSHTAIYMGDNKIIHAATSVKIESLNDDGTIDSTDLSEYRYKIYSIKRL